MAFHCTMGGKYGAVVGHIVFDAREDQSSYEFDIFHIEQISS